MKGLVLFFTFFLVQTTWASDYSCEAILIKGSEVKQSRLVSLRNDSKLAKIGTTEFKVSEIDQQTLILAISDTERREFDASATSLKPEPGKAAAHLNVLLKDGSVTIVCKVD